MHNLTLYTSNRLENLALILAQVVKAPLDPMQPETILVQSGGMQRWVSMQLAREHGIWAGADFPFPVAFAYDLCRKLLPDLSADYALAQDRMLWRIVSLLPVLLGEPDFAPIKAYLKDGDTLKLIQLAEKIAYHFDQYLIFRPHWSGQWEQGRPGGDLRESQHLAAEAWQSRLWREVAEGFETEHRAALLKRAMEALRQGHGEEKLPKRLCVFGISTLPPSYLDLLLAVSRHVPVHIFLLSPCSQYWGDLAGKREQIRDYRQLAQSGVRAQSRPEDASPLAGLGRLGRDFHELLTTAGVDALPLYSSNPSPVTLLEHLQEDLLNLERTLEQHKTALHDTSIQLHCCHSPMREMEVLHDLILDLLQRDQTLDPRDILIMNPDIETYAPFIQAVFGCPENQSQYLLFSIADQSPSRAAQAVRLFLDLLEFGQHRFEASRVTDLLEAPAIREMLRLDEKDCERIKDWVRLARIRWGTDRNFRTTDGLATHGQNTWESGLARLFLGYMTGPVPGPVHGIAPLGPLTNADQDLLGRLAGFLDRLRELWTSLNTPGTADMWQERLHWILDTFFPDNRDTGEMVLSIRAAITKLTTAMAENKADLEVDSRIMLHLIRRQLDESGAEGGFLASGLTFCGLRPMRAIPFRVICLTGLSSTAFPRQDIQPNFDLMAAAPRPADRSSRDDDRYLFLESLISARDTLILTYPGLSQADNSEAPPSVLVAELLDYLDSRYLVRGNKPSTSLITRHRLQAFHPDYFQENSPLFSYSAQNCAGAEALNRPPASETFFPPDATNTVAPASDEPLSLDELIRFLSHPARHLLKSLQVSPTDSEDEILDEEPLTPPSGLDGYGVAADLLQACLEDETSELEARLNAWQVLPPGPAGSDANVEICSTVRNLAEQVWAERLGLPAQGDAPTPEPSDVQPVIHDISLELDACRISGRIATYADHIVTYRPAKLKGPDMLRLWVLHLAARAANLDVCSAHVARDDIFHAPSLDSAEAQSILHDLAQLYARGMTAPLPFFPRSSLAYAQKRCAGKDHDASLAAALTQWDGNMAVKAEKDDASLAMIYRDKEPDWEEFEALALEVYGPLLENRHDA
jgi:exodeoxyribonuclease V gamma subunit